MGVVINLAARHNTGQLGGHFAYFQAGDKAGQIMGVRPQVTDYAGFPGNAGSGAPDGLLMSFRFQQGGSPAGGVFDLQQPDFAQLPVANHFAGLAYYGIAGIAVGHAENQAGLTYQAHQLKSLLYIGGPRLG